MPTAAAELLGRDPARWLRWQITQRGGMLWHECCATCVNFTPLEGDPAYGECPAQTGQYVERGDACHEWEPKKGETDAEPTA